ETDRDAILTMRTDAALHTLTGPGGFSESYYIKNVEWSREDTIYQTIRQDLACDAIVFTMEIEFYE
ncbi:hypothetical protein LRR18_18655, partial [Mangrovimonas sp. AS39]|uniref:hypothetical protein n=1 Tax=Mangrovimonas futianensis TaxID=2895523 RepID=UPI001E2FA468